MKLSSISLIVSALAAFSGSAVAAPAPLYARALEQVNSFERDLDVYPRESWVAVLERDIDVEPVDDLFARAQRHENPDRAAELLQSGVKHHTDAAEFARSAAKKQVTTAKQEEWNNIAGNHEQSAQSLKSIRADKHTYHKDTVAGAMRLGGNNIGHAKNSMKAAQKAILNPK